MQQIQPHFFTEIVQIDNTNFEVYSQKGGVGRRCTLSNLHKFLACKKKNISYDPTITVPPTADRNKVLVNTNTNNVYFADLDGYVVKLGGSGYTAGGGIVITNSNAIDFDGSDLTTASSISNTDYVVVSTVSNPKGARVLLGSLNFANQFVGTHDASTGLLPTQGTGGNGAIKKGDYWIISTGGTITGLLPNSVLVAQNVIIATADNATTAQDYSSIAAAAPSYTAGGGIAINGGTITNDAPDQIVTIAGASGTYPNFTLPAATVVTVVTASEGVEVSNNDFKLGGAITTKRIIEASANGQIEVEGGKSVQIGSESYVEGFVLAQNFDGLNENGVATKMEVRDLVNNILLVAQMFLNPDSFSIESTQDVRIVKKTNGFPKQAFIAIADSIVRVYATNGIGNTASNAEITVSDAIVSARISAVVNNLFVNNALELTKPTLASPLGNAKLVAYPNSRTDSGTPTNFLATDVNGILRSYATSIFTAGYDTTTVQTDTKNKWKGKTIYTRIFNSTNTLSIGFDPNSQLVTIIFSEPTSISISQLISAKTSRAESALSATIAGTSTSGGVTQYTIQIKLGVTIFFSGTEIEIQYIR